MKRRLLTGVLAAAMLLAGCGAEGSTGQTGSAATENGMGAKGSTEQIDSAGTENSAGAEDGTGQADGVQTDAAGQGKGGAQTDITGVVGSFTTTDLDGNEVTEAVFAEKDLTMLNIWGTYCGPCISEMPELGEISASLPENVQIIGLVCDVTPGNDTGTAKEIVDSTGADYLHILYNYDMAGFMQEIYAVPTTFFVDGEGNLLGEPVVGANVEAYRERLAQYLGE